MKIQCDVCENSPAAVICCSDEAALCAKCDVEVHAANKLASKHQRLLIQRLSHKLPPCDICQEKTAFIFGVEDRSLFCKECDEPIHSANSLTANHQRFLATGIRVALSSSRSRETLKQQLGPRPQMPNTQQNTLQIPSQHISGVTSPSWAVDELLHLSDYESCDKKEQLEFSELEWLTNMNLFGEQVEPLAAAEVPQLPGSLPINSSSCRPAQLYKKPRIGTLKEEEEDEHFTVPDLGLKCDCKPC